MDRTIHKSGILLLKPFVKEPWKEFTLSEIKKISKNKSHHYVFEALKKFVSLGVLKETKKGNTNIYSVNYEKEEPISYLASVEYITKDERKDIPYRILAKITKKIKSPFFILLIGGSYAEKKQKPSSDLDISFIIPVFEPKKQYSMALKEGELTVPLIHGFVFTQEEFYLMLANEEFNLGKELARKHVIAYGAEAYYKILFEAMKHGFKG